MNNDNDTNDTTPADTWLNACPAGESRTYTNVHSGESWAVDRRPVSVSQRGASTTMTVVTGGQSPN